MWRTVGFLMSFAVVIEGMTLIAFIVVLVGGKQKREQGWTVVSGLLLLAGLIQCAGMAIIVSSLASICAMEMSGFPKTEVNLLFCCAGIPVRQRRPLLPRLEARYLLDPVHHQLVCPRRLGQRHRRICLLASFGRRLRINTRHRARRVTLRSTCKDHGNHDDPNMEDSAVTSSQHRGAVIHVRRIWSVLR